MAVIGVGIDVCDLERFARVAGAHPGPARAALHPRRGDAPAGSLAARFAAKEALAKALGAPGGLAWHDAEVVSEESGRPLLELRGTVRGPRRRARRRHVHVSLSHDAGIASAVVVLES